MICDALELWVRAGVPGRIEPQVLSLSIVKLDADRLMAVLTDVSRRVERDRLLHGSDLPLGAFTTRVTDYAWVNLDQHGCIDGWNESIARLTGHDAAVIGQPYSIFSPPDTNASARLLMGLERADRDGWSVEDGWRVRADGSRFWASTMISPLRVHSDVSPGDSRSSPAADHAYCLVIRDISDQRAAGELRRRDHDGDPLTGLNNRRAFYDAAGVELDSWRLAPRPLSLILLEIDCLKRINERHGRAAGDAMLHQVATTIAVAVADRGVVARVGGDTFSILMASTDLLAACAMAERLRSAVAAESGRVAGASLACTVSGGVATMERRIRRTRRPHAPRQRRSARGQGSRPQPHRVQLRCLDRSNHLSPHHG